MSDSMADARFARAEFDDAMAFLDREGVPAKYPHGGYYTLADRIAAYGRKQEQSGRDTMRAIQRGEYSR
jgi:hypothetical protein